MGERRGGAEKGEPTPVTPPVRQDRRPFASRGSRPRRRGAGTEQEAGRRREHLRRAAFFVKPAMITSPTQREPTRSPAFFLAPYPSFESLPMSASSSRCAPVPSTFPHEQPPNRAFPVVAWHPGDPTPSLQDTFVRVPLRGSCCRSGRGTPDDAPPRREPGAAPCLEPLCFSLRAVWIWCWRKVSHPSRGHAHPSARCHAYATSCLCAWMCGAAVSRSGATTPRHVILLAGLRVVSFVSAGACVRASWTMRTPAPRLGSAAPLSARNSV
jgi:hypothetical protein